MAKPRTRFDIHVVFPDGYRMSFVSRKDRDLSVHELTTALRRYADYIDAGTDGKVKAVSHD